MDFFQDFPLCCQDTAVETIFRPPTDSEDPDREGIAHANTIMEKPWKPPLYRDTSLLVAALDAEEANQSETPKTITPSVGVVSCDDSIPSRSVIKNDDDVSLPPDFVPPKDPLPKSRSLEVEVFSSHPPNDANTDDDARSLSYSNSQSSEKLTPNLRLEPKDVVCGRGAPTSIHPGNLSFKKTIKKHEMTYLCSTRSEKPKIAMKLLEEFRAEGVRFVKRERSENGCFIWIEIGEQRSYEKICQSLREGAPKLRRQMMVAEAKQKKTKNDEEKNQNQLPSNHYDPRRQQRQDFDSGFIDETRRTDVGPADASPFSPAAQAKNEEIRYDPIGEQNHRNIEWLHYYQNPERKDHRYEIARHYDIPYYVHLPPHLGGERLFRDHIE